MYQATTRLIEVRVEPFYLEEKSDPEEDYFVWAYHVEIENRSPVTVQLLRRYWHITDSLGRVQEIRGEGVIGEQPVLAPGERYEYTSGTPLAAPSGVMAGSYQMVTDDGEGFEVEIPAFSLDSPHEGATVN